MRKTLILLTILSFATSLFGATDYPIRKLGGLNTRTNVFEIQDSESPDMSNFVLDEAGTLTERNLFKYYNTVSVGNLSLTNVYKFYKSSDEGYLISPGGTNLYKASAGALSDISVSTNSVVSGSHWSFETFTDGTNEVVFAANNNIPLKMWNGSDATFYERGYPGTNCNLLKKHKARLWAAGSKAYPYRIYYSSLNDGDDWNTTGGSFDLPSYERIMALEVLSDTLFILTRTSVYAVLGDTPNEFTIQKTRSTVGTHATKSVVVGNRIIIFLNKSGVYAFDGDESVNISEGIQPTIDAISNSYISTAAGLYDTRGRYWLSYTSTNGSYNDKILVYDTVIKQWYIIDGVYISSFFKAEGGTDKGEIFAGTSNPVGYLWQLQTSSSLEQITHSTQTQLSSGVTSNTVVTSTPTVELLNGIDGYTKLMLHFNGADGATTYTSEDYSKRTVTFVNQAQLDTADKEFGTASLLLDGSGDWVTVPNSTDFNFSGEFTIDFWVNFDTRVQSDGIAGNQAADGTAGWALRVATTDSTELNFNSYTAGALDFSLTTSGAGLGGEWTHIAVVRSGNVITIYVNGTSCGSTTFTGSMGTSVSPCRVGTDYTVQETDGWIDEFRITKGLARWTSDFTVYGYEYRDVVNNGSLTSANLQINASGQASLGTIMWQESVSANSDIQFTTRTGVTDDTVEYTGWEPWVSTSTVVCPVTDSTTWTTSGTITRGSPTTPQPRDILYYETDNHVSPPSVQLTVSGAASYNAYTTTTIPIKDLSNYKFVGFWLKSAVTGNAVELALTNTTGNVVGYTTANVVSVSKWEYFYWPLAGYSDVKDISSLKVTYKGDGSGNIYLGAISAYDFLDSGDTITSTPNDYIQYRAILGANDLLSLPKLVKANEYVVTISYSSTSGSSESALTSYWLSKKFDFGKPNTDKYFNWIELTAESQDPVTYNTVYIDYTLDDGRVSGTLSKTFVVTGRTTKLRFYFPSGSYGRNMDFKIRDTDVDDDITVKNAVIDFRMEGNL